jgi:hypothetical protein
MNTYKEALLMSIESTSVWRASNAIKFPGDERNMACSEALRNAAETVLALPDDHELFVKLEAVNEPGCECWSEQESQIISRWGFHHYGEADFSGSQFVVDLIEYIDIQLDERAFIQQQDEFRGKLIELVDNEWFRDELDCRFESNLSEDYKDELAEEFFGELMETLSERLTGEQGEKPVEDIDKVVSEFLTAQADSIGSHAEAFIQDVPNNIWV